MLHFADVTTAMSSCRHIHYVWATGVIGDCAVGYSSYCPTSPVTRDEMARFLVKGFGLKLYGP